MIDSLQDKRIFIVGGSSGLGLAVAKKAGALGCRIIVASRGAAAKQRELADAIGPEVEAHSLDLTSEDQTRVALEKIGTIDHLVIASRPAITPAPFAQTGLAQAKAAFETKFWGPCQLIQKALGSIAPNGSIVLTTGIAGEKVFPNHATMMAVDGAVEALCRALAVELAPIRVNAVSPGFVAPKPPETVEYAKKFPAGRVAAPEEVADAYLYLMGNPYITGVSLVVDGGARLI